MHIITASQFSLCLYPCVSLCLCPRVSLCLCVYLSVSFPVSVCLSVCPSCVYGESSESVQLTCWRPVMHVQTWASYSALYWFNSLSCVYYRRCVDVTTVFLTVSVCLCVCLSVCLSSMYHRRCVDVTTVFLTVSVCLCVCLSVCLSSMYHRRCVDVTTVFLTAVQFREVKLSKNPALRRAVLALTFTQQWYIYTFSFTITRSNKNRWTAADISDRRKPTVPWSLIWVQHIKTLCQSETNYKPIVGVSCSAADDLSRHWLLLRWIMFIVCTQHTTSLHTSLTHCTLHTSLTHNISSHFTHTHHLFTLQSHASLHTSLTHCTLHTSLTHCTLNTSLIHCTLHTSLTHCTLNTSLIHCTLHTSLTHRTLHTSLTHNISSHFTHTLHGGTSMTKFWWVMQHWYHMSCCFKPVSAV